MNKIILASKSKARQKILKQIGLKFKVDTAAVKEIRYIKGGVSKLVVKNALKKAAAVSKKYKHGIIIAADTIVLVGKKIIGKPKNVNDAFNILKLLCKRPQWVYTGVAVIDIDKKKQYTFYDKTKIYMYPLSDKIIRKYLKMVSPLDKAGGFDIQGIGGIFIDRIEGCYYNVVGLPLAKLVRVLDKIGVKIF